MMRSTLLVLSLMVCSLAQAAVSSLPISVKLDATKSMDGASFSQLPASTVAGSIGVNFYIGKLPMDQLIVRVTAAQNTTSTGVQWVQVFVDVFDSTEKKILSSGSAALKVPGGITHGSAILIPFSDFKDGAAEYSGAIEATLN